MNRSTFAFFVALLIHLMFMLLFWILYSIDYDTLRIDETKDKKIKISLKEIPKKTKYSGDIIDKVQNRIAPPMPKGSQLKHLSKPPIKFEPQKTQKEQTLNKNINQTKQQAKTEPKTKSLTKNSFVKIKNETNSTKAQVKEEQKNTLYSMLLKDKSAQENKKNVKKSNKGSNIDQNIKELYGSTFGELSIAQQKYIMDNQEIMRRITQQVLTRVAGVNLPRDLNVNKINVIEFYLHPNGDMSDFKFLQKSGYFILDDTTKETIEYAYSRYPRPSEKTLIRYNVFYNLARY